MAFFPYNMEMVSVAICHTLQWWCTLGSTKSISKKYSVAITGAINGGMSQMKICIKLGLESLKLRQ